MPAMTVNVLSVSWGETTKNTPTPQVTTPNSTGSHHKLVIGRSSSAAFVDMVRSSGAGAAGDPVFGLPAVIPPCRRCVQRTMRAMSAAGYAESSAAVRTPALFGRVMALVALTVGCATLGVWVARDWGGAGWFVAWLLSLGCLIGLNVANARGNTGLALALLFAFGLLVGASVATTVNYYAQTDPVAVRQAFAATALFVAAMGSAGYAVRRDLSFLYRLLFWLLLALIGAGIVLIFVHIPAIYTAWSIAGLGDLRPLHRGRLQPAATAGTNEAIPLAAGIFLDVLNIFLLFLRLFARSN